MRSLTPLLSRGVLIVRYPKTIRYASATTTGEHKDVITKDIIQTKMQEFVTWYEQLTGIDEVRMMQNRVIEAQDNFIKCRERRREVGKQLAVIQAKLKDIYAELDTTTRGEERYLHLIQQEHVALKEDRKLQMEFSQAESEERERFNLLTSCVKESHEKERTQADRTKYWSLIASVIGTMLGVGASTISNFFRMRELRRLVAEKKEDPEPQYLKSYEEKLSNIVQDIQGVIKQNQPSQEASWLRVFQLNNRDPFRDIQNSLDDLSSSLRHIQSKIDRNPSTDQCIECIPEDITSTLKSYKDYTRNVAFLSTVTIIITSVALTILSRSN